MKPIVITLFIVVLLFGAVLGLPLFIGIWLPDVISAPQHTLAEQHLTNGHSFAVVQYWNRGDFYSTELLHTLPDGTAVTHVLDSDDSKSWRLPLVVNEQQRTATITLGGGRVKILHWEQTKPETE